jgi:hypothetical protein
MAMWLQVLAPIWLMRSDKFYAPFKLSLAAACTPRMAALAASSSWACRWAPASWWR